MSSSNVECASIAENTKNKAAVQQPQTAAAHQQAPASSALQSGGDDLLQCPQRVFDKQVEQGNRKKELFQQYLAHHGVMQAVNAAFSKLFNSSSLPSDPVQFIGQHLLLVSQAEKEKDDNMNGHPLQTDAPPSAALQTESNHN